MWQAEDMVRAFNLDIDKVKSSIIKDFNGEEADLIILIKWYQDLIRKQLLLQSTNFPGCRQLDLCVAPGAWVCSRVLTPVRRIVGWGSAASASSALREIAVTRSLRACAGCCVSQNGNGLLLLLLRRRLQLLLLLRPQIRRPHRWRAWETTVPVSNMPV